MSKHQKKNQKQHQRPRIVQPERLSDVTCSYEVPCTLKKKIDGKWVPWLTFTADSEATQHRLAQGIPELLAEVLPADMEITSMGESNSIPTYLVKQIVFSGTAEEIVDYLAAKQRAAHKVNSTKIPC